MTGEAPPHERLARQLIEGRVGGVCGDERGLARAVDPRGRAAPRAVAAAVVPRQAQEMRREQTLDCDLITSEFIETDEASRAMGLPPGQSRTI